MLIDWTMHFVSWYGEDGNSKYINEWERITTAQGFAETTNLNWRHDFLVTLNSLSPNMQKMRLQLVYPPSLRLSDFPPRTQWNGKDDLDYFGRVDNFKDFWRQT